MYILNKFIFLFTISILYVTIRVQIIFSFSCVTFYLFEQLKNYKSKYKKKINLTPLEGEMSTERKGKDRSKKDK